MIKFAEDRLSNKLAEPVDRPTVRRILVQRQMCSAFVVIASQQGEIQRFTKVKPQERPRTRVPVPRVASKRAVKA